MGMPPSTGHARSPRRPVSSHQSSSGGHVSAMHILIYTHCPNVCAVEELLNTCSVDMSFPKHVVWVLQQTTSTGLTPAVYCTFQRFLAVMQLLKHQPGLDVCPALTLVAVVHTLLVVTVRPTCWAGSFCFGADSVTGVGLTWWLHCEDDTATGMVLRRCLHCGTDSVALSQQQPGRSQGRTQLRGGS